MIDYVGCGYSGNQVLDYEMSVIVWGGFVDLYNRGWIK